MKEVSPILHTHSQQQSALLEQNSVHFVAESLNFWGNTLEKGLRKVWAAPRTETHRNSAPSLFPSYNTPQREQNLTDVIRIPWKADNRSSNCVGNIMSSVLAKTRDSIVSASHTFMPFATMIEAVSWASRGCLHCGYDRKFWSDVKPSQLQSKIWVQLIEGENILLFDTPVRWVYVAFTLTKSHDWVSWRPDVQRGSGRELLYSHFSRQFWVQHRWRLSFTSYQRWRSTKLCFSQMEP